MSDFISGRSISKRYGSTTALDKVDFDMGAGEVVGLIGPNGAGKSTLLKAILGLIRFDGELTVLGQSPRSARAELLKSVSYIADVSSLPGWMRVSRLLDYMQGVHPGFDRKKAVSYLERTDVQQDKDVSTLSKGMKTQLHLAIIMAVDAKLLILDEPTLGLDVIFRSEFHQTLQNDFFDPNRSILVTTHQVEEIEEFLTRVIFINKGKIALDSPVSEIGNRYTRLSVDQENLSHAQGLGSMHSRQSGQGSVLIYDGKDSAKLAEFGNTSTPNLAELFVAIVKGQA
jgi:ABC-2 type transport system ATP-binding protein